MEKRNSQHVYGQPMEQSRNRLRCGSLSITAPLSLLANELDIQSVLHGQMSLAAVHQFCVIHEAMNSFKNLKIH